jgi:hypothetical protein
MILALSAAVLVGDDSGKGDVQKTRRRHLSCVQQLWNPVILTEAIA